MVTLNNYQTTSEEGTAFVIALNKLYGKDAALVAANFLSRADGLETIPDMVRHLRKNSGESVANFTVGYFGAGMTLPGFEDNNDEMD